MQKLRISYKKFNPNFHHLKDALKNDDLRFIFLKGGSSSAKSYSIAQCFLLECLGSGYNTKVYRKTGASIEDSIYKTFKEVAYNLHIDKLFRFTENKIECLVNGSYITFSGLDNPEKIKGLESYQYVFCEEISEFDISDFKQIRKRLRGRKGQKIVAAFNPVSETLWIKTEIFDKEKFTELPNDLRGKLKDPYTKKVLSAEYSTIYKKLINTGRYVYNPRTGKDELHKPDTLVLWSTYLNNFWVVGSPCGAYGYYDRQTIADFEKDKITDYNQYRIYALGEWGTIQTGGEYLPAFNQNTHITNICYNKDYPIHVSIDNNVLPYISVPFYQIINGKAIQIYEICASDPDNTATSAGRLANNYLKNIGYNDIVYLYGDVSTKSRNTIDDEKRSFADKFIEQLSIGFHVSDRMDTVNPSVSMSGEFLNSLFVEGKILINEQCKKSIYDYSGVKRDSNGCILKKRIKNKETGQSYEEFGHLTDCLRYFICGAFKDEYIKFSNKRKRNDITDNDMKYYNTIPECKYKVAFFFIDLNNKYIALTANVLDNRCYISDVLYQDNMLDMQVYAKNAKAKYCVVECDKPYFHIIRDLRSDVGDVRASTPKPDYQTRIASQMDNVKENFYFSSNYDDDGDYLSFMNSVLDYDNKNNYECIYALSYISSHIIRNLLH